MANKRKRGLTIGPRARAVLRAIENGFDLLTITPGEASRSLRYSGVDDLRAADAEREYWNNYRAIKRLKEQRLISERRVGNKISLELTEKGKGLTIRGQITKKAGLLPGKSLCLVSFDIPESQRGARDALRQIFREAEFQRIHNSLWATRKDVVADFVALIKRMGAEKWISVFVGERKVGN